MPKSAKRTAPEPASSKSNRLVNRLKPKQTHAAAVAEMMVEGLTMNAFAAVAHSKVLGEVDLTETVGALILQTRQAGSGDLSSLEAILAAQVITLNAMFTQYVSQTARMTLVDQVDRFTRLALKAQGQCRATLETLAAIKNPPVFTRQANITSGPQQVNNGLVLNGTPPRAAIQKGAPNELLEADGERLDGRTAQAAGAGDSAVAAMGALDRAADAQRKGAGIAQRRPRRRTEEISRTR